MSRRSFYQVTGSWDHLPDRPARRTTTDKALARRIARDLARKGARVVVEKRTGYEWRTLYELDGPARLAEQRAADKAEQQRREAADRAARQAAARRADDARRARQQHAQTRALMAPPDIVRPETQRRARHITGGQR